MAKTNTVQFRPGDELVISRRRFHQTTDPETQEKEISHEDQVVASVRCPEDLEVTGGEILPDWEENQKFVVIKLKCRNLGTI